jgi:hypothetical protein
MRSFNHIPTDMIIAVTILRMGGMVSLREGISCI